MPTLSAQRVFTMADQLRFAELSGDRNPMHLDALAARRTQAGVPVVHGLHVLLWALDRLAEVTPDIAPIARLRVTFVNSIQLGDPVESWLMLHDATGFKMQVLVHGAVLARVSGQFGDLSPAAAVAVADHPPEWPGIQAAEPAFEQMPGLQGRVTVGPIEAAIADHFPHAVQAWGALRLAALTATTTLVGMICPGLHSIFGGLDVGMRDATSGDALAWRVGAFDPRFRRMRLDVDGPGLGGTLSCFSRLPPSRQTAIETLAPFVAPDAFAGSVAMVVGGSRGLGELSAKLLAAGGARVLLTYAVGQVDATRVAAEITAWGGACDILAYDVRRPAEAQLSGLAHEPTHLYYFATPSVFRGKAGLFDPQRLAEFILFYVTGFFDLVTALRPRGVFYPSSTAIEERPREMTEYAMAKVAGELLCADITKYTATSVVVARLPRLPTDLTASITPVETADPMAVLLPVLRQVQAIA